MASSSLINNPWTSSSSLYSSSRHEILRRLPPNLLSSSPALSGKRKGSLASSISSQALSVEQKQPQTAIEDGVKNIAEYATQGLKDANEALDNVISKLTSNFDRAGESAGDTLLNFSNDLKETTGKLGTAAVDLVRNTIILVEDGLAKGFTYVVYSYGSWKNILPPDIQGSLNASESKLAEVFSPVELVFQKASSALQGLEVSLGLDSNDPLIPLVLVLGASATVWGSYWIFTSSGYAGDLSPQSTLELLKGRENVALIDIRPDVLRSIILHHKADFSYPLISLTGVIDMKDLRERDGIPDLRRGARFRYVSVTVPEVDVAVRKLLKGGNSLEDMLVAAVIRNLKVVQGRSKIIVMDAEGARSKGVARSLRRLGIKNSYLLQGGFQSWVKDGLRIKELRPETALQILNEEAEAIIEAINPTPLNLLGYGLGLIAAAYALKEWEKTLQLIGIIGIGQTIYWRLASYEDAEDFKQDVRLLFAPARVGGEAISWAASKLEANRNGLTTAPSSVDVQKRVLQAAAKHESQPTENEEPSTDPSLSELTDSNNKADLSEA